MPSTNSSPTPATSRPGASTEPVTLRAFVAEQCRRRGISQLQLAARAGVARSGLYAALNDPASRPRITARLAAFFAVDEAWLRSLSGSAGRAAPPTATPLRALVVAAAKQRGTSVKAVLDQVKASRSTVYAAMSGAGTPSPRVAGAIATALGVPVEQVLEAVGIDPHPVTVAMARNGLRVTDVGNSVARLRNSGRVSASQLHRAAVRVGDPALPQTLASQRRPVCDTGTRLGALADATCAKTGGTLTSLAAEAGVSRQYLSLLLAGSLRNPSQAAVAGLADALGVRESELRGMLAEIPRPFAAAGADLSARRRDAGLLQADLAEACGVSQSKVSAWETGMAAIPAHHQVTLRQLLNRDAQ